MKRIIVLQPALKLWLASTALAAMLALVLPTPAHAVAEWTIMVYMNGDNDLDEKAFIEFNEFEQRTMASNVNVIVQYDRSPANDDGKCWRYKIKAEDPINTGTITADKIEQITPDPDMGNPQTLADFAIWAIGKYPANKYSLIMWDHGSGWYKGGDQGKMKGFSYDLSSGNTIDVSNGEFGNAMKQITESLKRKLDHIAWQACLMGMWEVLDIAKDYANYANVSEQVMVIPPGYNFGTFITAVNSNPGMDAKVLGEKLLGVNDDGQHTKSLIDLSKIDALTSKIDKLAQELQASRAGYSTEINTALSNTRKFYYTSHIDLSDFATKIFNTASLPVSLKNAAAECSVAVKNARVITPMNSATHANAHGIAIYHNGSEAFNGNYSLLPISGKTCWDEYLQNKPAHAGLWIFPTSPQNGDMVFGGTFIVIRATDPDGIKKIEYYVDGVLQATSYQSPYTYEVRWPAKAVDCKIEAKAYDNLNNTNTATLVIRKAQGADAYYDRLNVGGTVYVNCPKCKGVMSVKLNEIRVNASNQKRQADLTNSCVCGSWTELVDVEQAYRLGGGQTGLFCYPARIFDAGGLRCADIMIAPYQYPSLDIIYPTAGQQTNKCEVKLATNYSGNGIIWTNSLIGAPSITGALKKIVWTYNNTQSTGTAFSDYFTWDMSLPANTDPRTLTVKIVDAFGTEVGRSVTVTYNSSLPFRIFRGEFGDRWTHPTSAEKVSPDFCFTDYPNASSNYKTIFWYNYWDGGDRMGTHYQGNAAARTKEELLNIITTSMAAGPLSQQVTDGATPVYVVNRNEYQSGSVNTGRLGAITFKEIYNRLALMLGKDSAGKYRVWTSASKDARSESDAIPDLVPPAITIDAPQYCRPINPGGTTAITATVVDDVSAVTKVEFYVDGTLKATDLAAPYSYVWTVPAGNALHTIMIKAYDACDNVGTKQTTIIANSSLAGAENIAYNNGTNLNVYSDQSNNPSGRAGVFDDDPTTSYHWYNGAWVQVDFIRPRSIKGFAVKGVDATTGVTRVSIDTWNGASWTRVVSDQATNGASAYTIFNIAAVRTNKVRLYCYASGDVWLSQFEVYLSSLIDIYPVAYWKLDDNGGNYAADASGSNNYGTLINAPAWVDGRVGKALNFDSDIGGDGLYSSGGELREGVQIKDSDLLDLTSAISIAGWFKLAATGSGKGMVSKWNAYEVSVQPDGILASLPGLRPDNGQVFASASVSRGQWHHIAVTYDGSSIKIYLNGSLLRTVSQTGQLAVDCSDLWIGSNDGGGQFSGAIDDVRIYSRALSANEVNDLCGQTSDLLGRWKFDEASGTVTDDASVNACDGGLANHATFVAGKLGNAVNLDGDDYVVMTGVPGIGGSMTLTAWVKTSATQVSKGIAGRWTPENYGAGFQLMTDAGGTKAGFMIGNNANTAYCITTASSINDGAWHQIACVFDGVTRMIYFDGLEQARSSWSGIGNPSTNFEIGRYAQSSSSCFAGQIDEVRLYNRVLSQAELQALYINGGQNGPAGYWKFDEATGSSAYDSSGYSNNGTLAGGPVRSIGLSGKCLSFDGLDDYVNIANSTSLNPASITIAMWLNLRSDPNVDGNNNWRSLIHKGSTWGATTGYDIVLEEDRQICWDTGTNPADRWWTGVYIPIGSWTHLVVSYNAAIGSKQIYQDGVLKSSKTVSALPLLSNTSDLLINNPSVRYPNGKGNMPGQIDEVRIYNRALDAAEVMALYKMNALAGYWNLDETTGPTAKDVSGKGNNGTLANHASFVAGKNGNAINLDGDDYISMSSNQGISGPLTLSVWVKTSETQAGKGIVGQWNSPNWGGGYLLMTDATGSKGYFIIGNGAQTANGVSTTSNINDSVWHHLVGVYDGIGYKIYFDGAEQSARWWSGIAIRSNPFEIGRYNQSSSTCFKGQVDDVRVYSRALTVDEIKQYFNGTKAAHVAASNTGDSPGIPLITKLSRSAPNPFADQATINFQLAAPAQTTITVYNVLGQTVRALVNECLQPGYHSVKWDGKDANGNKVAAGVYLYRMSAGDYTKTNKLTVLR